MADSFVPDNSAASGNSDSFVADSTSPSQPSALSRTNEFLNTPINHKAAMLMPPGALASMTESSQEGADQIANKYRTQGVQIDPHNIKNESGLFSDALESYIQKETSAGNPFRAGLGSFLASILDATTSKAGFSSLVAGVNRSESNLLRGFTTPAAITTSVAAPYSKVASGLATAYFGFRGAQDALMPEQVGESYADSLERRLGGASTLLFASAGGAANAKDIARDFIRTKAGLTGSLADKANAAFARQEAIKAQAARDISAVDQKYSEDLSNLTQQQTDAATANDSQLQDTFKNVFSSAAKVAMEEHARVTQPFIDIAADTKAATVATASDIRSLLSTSLSDFQAQDKEIPPAAFKALSNRGNLISTDVYMGNDNEAATALKKVENPDTNNLNFYDVTRIKDDFYDAAASAKDGAVRAGLYKAAEKLDAIQNDFATKNGFGQKYRAAKTQYMFFKKELGNDLMSNWISYHEEQDLTLARKVSALTNTTTGPAIRTVLSKFGIDLKPFDQLVAMSKETDNSSVKLLAKEHGEAIKNIQDRTKELLESVTDKNNPLVPGMSDAELAGKSNQEIASLKMSAFAKQMTRKGISNPWSIFMLGYGLLSMAAGHEYGAIPAAYGGSKLLLPKVVLSPAFQEWAVRDAGIEPTNRLMVLRYKQGLANLYPILRRAAASQVPAAVTSAAHPKPQQQ